MTPAMPDFASLFERLSTQEINSILDEQLSGDSSAESRSKESTAYGKSNDVDRAFDELMSNK